VIEENARVVRREGDYAWVETQRKSACGQCSARKGCGTSVLDKVLGRRRSVVRVLNPVDAAPGDEVVIGLGEGAFVRGSLAVYALPLVTLLLGAILGEWLGGSDALSVLGGLLGLAAGFAWVARFTRRIGDDRRYQPVILRRLPAPALRAHGVFAP